MGSCAFRPAVSPDSAGAAGCWCDACATRPESPTRGADAELSNAVQTDEMIGSGGLAAMKPPPAAPPKAVPAVAKVQAKALNEAQISKIHSALRWDKPWAEIQEVIKSVDVSVFDALVAQDPKNGNCCLHIAAQNGHRDLVKQLLEEKADVNAQNFKGQTPLHMSIEYDFYFQSVQLLEAGADRGAVNADGHPAIKGIEGGKEGADAWDSPLTILKAAGDDRDELDFAMSKLEQVDPADVDKALVVQAGMAKRKCCKDHWNADRFADIIRRL